MFLEPVRHLDTPQLLSELLTIGLLRQSDAPLVMMDRERSAVCLMVRVLVLLATAGTSTLAYAGSPTSGEGGVRVDGGGQSNPAPNVLLIALDDFRPELPVFGRTWLHTPALDSIAARGTAFLRAYVQAPQCCPTRNSFLVSEHSSCSKRLRGGHCGFECVAHVLWIRESVWPLAIVKPHGM